MYSYDDRKKAVELLIEYDLQYAKVVHELGYPNVNSLKNWYLEYMENQDLHIRRQRSQKYTDEQRANAVNYYLTHGKNINRTCKNLGYPSRTLLTAWVMNDVPSES